MSLSDHAITRQHRLISLTAHHALQGRVPHQEYKGESQLTQSLLIAQLTRYPVEYLYCAVALMYETLEMNKGKVRKYGQSARRFLARPGQKEEGACQLRGWAGATLQCCRLVCVSRLSLRMSGNEMYDTAADE